MLVVISNPTALSNEASFINQLFDEGLELFHLRKPSADIIEIKDLLEKINPVYHQQIALHQHHELAIDYGITRLHFTEGKRREMSKYFWEEMKKKQLILSTSIHTVDEYQALSSCFDYVFWGPVFNSISKEGYNSTLQEGFVFPVKDNHPKAIAIGGINEHNLEQVKAMQFNGAALLGTIWQKSEDSIYQFKAVQKAWKKTDR